MNRLIAILGLAAMPLPGLAQATAGEAKPVWQASAQRPPVVTHPPNPSEPMALAAAELRSYLGRILRTKLPTKPPGDDTPTIHLCIAEDAGLSDEGYELHARGNSYRITGGGQLGLLFGAYEFLRRWGGCRFSDLGPDGEHVPRKQRIEADAGPLRMKPKLWYRGLQFYFGEDAELCRQRIDWMAKNGLNYIAYTPAPEGTDPQTMFHIDRATGKVVKPDQREVRYGKAWFDRELRGAIRKRGLKLDMNHHNLLYWLPTGRYFKEHPEWYALVDGKRGGRPSQLCICTSNRQAVATLIDNVRKYLRENPEVKIVGVIPEDGYGMCQCEKCVGGDVDPKEAFRRTNPRIENRSKSSRYHKLLGSVALAIRDEFPDVLVGGAAYVDLLWPARHVELQPNTTVWVALYWRDGCRPMAPGNTSDRNQHFLDILQEWKKVYPGRLIVYEYYMGMSAQSSLPYPISEVICEDWIHLKRLGVEGATIQCWTENHSVYTLNNLAFARCGWYDRVDHAELLNDFLLGSYGSVADEIRPIFEGMIRDVRRHAKEKGDLLPSAGNVCYFLDEVGRDTIRQALTAARKKADDDRQRRQIEKLAAAVRYWEMAAEVFALRAEASRLAKTDPKAALAVLEKALNQSCPRLQEYLKTSMPPGWQGVRVAGMWTRATERMEKTAAGLRK